MKRQAIRQLAMITGLGLATLVAATACTSAKAPAAAAPKPTASPSVATTHPTTQATTRPTTPASHSASPTHPTPVPPRCLGAVLYKIDASVGGPPGARLCMAVGGMLRIDNAGPGYVEMTPDNKTDCSYEAAVHECRLIGTGTVRVTVTQRTTFHFTLVIANAGSPPSPPTACQNSGTYVLHATDSGPPWGAICVRKQVTLQVRDLGPEGFEVQPAGAVSCQYEAAVRNCRFLRTGTVMFTIDRSGIPRPLTVVVVG